MKRRMKITVVALAIVANCSGAIAATLDQLHDVPTNNGISSGNTYWVQTFGVGLEGTLDRVEVRVTSIFNSPTSTNWKIVNTSLNGTAWVPGSPNDPDDVLASGVIPMERNLSDAWRILDISPFDMQVYPDDHFAFAFFTNGFSMPFDPNNGYEDGELQARSSTNNQYINYPEYDLMFRTFVAIPEPTTFTLAAFALLGLVGFGWRASRYP